MASLTHNVGDVRAYLKRLNKSQIPFATALALNDTAADVALAEQDALDESFDAPTPFTKKGFYTKRANKRTMSARIGVKSIQAEYLSLGVRGGIRRPKARAIVVPGKIKLNKYGNMAKGSLRRISSKGDTFVSNRGDRKTAHLKPGIYRRPKRGKYRNGGKGNKNRGVQRGVELIASFADSASYAKRLAFYDVARAEARRVYVGHYERRFLEALKSAK